MSKQHENKQQVFHTMKVNNEKAIEVNSDLKINVDEQHVDKKMRNRWWGWSSVDDSCSKPPWKNEPECGTGNQAFAMKNLLTKLIQKEHTQIWWNYCGKMFKNRNVLCNLIYKACESTCHECSANDEVENGKEDIIV